VGGVLRAERKAQNKTLLRVSSDAGVSLGFLSEVERGTKEVSSELLQAVCSALNIPLSKLLITAGKKAKILESHN
jgi:transcriptional regulator with XRE-family HTH domain